MSWNWLLARHTVGPVKNMRLVVLSVTTLFLKNDRVGDGEVCAAAAVGQDAGGRRHAWPLLKVPAVVMDSVPALTVPLKVVFPW